MLYLYETGTGIGNGAEMARVRIVGARILILLQGAAEEKRTEEPDGVISRLIGDL